MKMTKRFAKRLGKILSVFKSKGGDVLPQLPASRKMVIVGDGDCGKTCLVTRMFTGDFVDVGYLPTVFETTDAVTVNTGSEQVDLTIFDTAGQDDYDRLRAFSYLDVDVAIVCFNLADTDTLTNVTERWAPEIKNFCGTIPIILVGNKKDIRDPPLSIDNSGVSSCISDNSVFSSSSSILRNSSTVSDNLNSISDDDENNDSGFSGNIDDREEQYNSSSRYSCLIPPSPASSARMPFHVQAPVKHSEGASIAKKIGAIAYFETSALSGDNVEELLLAATKASVLGSKKSKTFKPFLGTLKSWKSVKGLEHLSRRVI